MHIRDSFPIFYFLNSSISFPNCFNFSNTVKPLNHRSIHQFYCLKPYLALALWLLYFILVVMMGGRGWESIILKNKAQNLGTNKAKRERNWLVLFELNVTFLTYHRKRKQSCPAKFSSPCSLLVDLQNSSLFPSLSNRMSKISVCFSFLQYYFLFDPRNCNNSQTSFK